MYCESFGFWTWVRRLSPREHLILHAPTSLPKFSPPGRPGPRHPGTMARAISIDPVADLKARLLREASDQARAFWTRYLKGARNFHGVPMAKVKTCVRTWWSDHGLDTHPANVGKRV